MRWKRDYTWALVLVTTIAFVLLRSLLLSETEDELIYGNWSEDVDNLKFRLVTDPEGYPNSLNRYAKIYIEVANLGDKKRRLPWSTMNWKSEVIDESGNPAQWPTGVSALGSGGYQPLQEIIILPDSLYRIPIYRTSGAYIQPDGVGTSITFNFSVIAGLWFIRYDDPANYTLSMHLNWPGGNEHAASIDWQGRVIIPPVSLHTERSSLLTPPRGLFRFVDFR